MNGDSKQYSWRWVTVDSQLQIGECELLYAYLVVSAASTDTYLYNGTNATGDKVATIESAVVTGHEFKPPVPIYCNKGLYIDIGTNVTGVLVMWRAL